MIALLINEDMMLKVHITPNDINRMGDNVVSILFFVLAFFALVNI